MQNMNLYDVADESLSATTHSGHLRPELACL